MSSAAQISAFPKFSRPVWAVIDAAAVRHNLQQLLARGGNRTSLLAVLKADAYGHGAVALARLIENERVPDAPCGVRMLGVASVDEGRQLRAAGIAMPILLLSAILPDEAAAVVQADLTPTVFTRELALALNDAGKQRRCCVPIHLKIDSGMNRIGARREEFIALWHNLQQLSHLRIEGLYTHFACADGEDDAMTGVQLKYFEDTLRACGIEPDRYTRHAANSAAFGRYDETHFDMARVGLTLYGVWPSPCVKVAGGLSLRPVMSLQARVTHVHAIEAGESVSYGARWKAARPSRIATIAVGYADGYMRALSGRAQVLLRGRRAPVCGTITMDQILVDVTDFEPNVEIGEIVTLWGCDENGEILGVEEVAQWAGTIAYEMTCGVASRVPRIYQNL